LLSPIITQSLIMTLSLIITQPIILTQFRKMVGTIIGPVNLYPTIKIN
jgi:hypothetical protein